MSPNSLNSTAIPPYIITPPPSMSFAIYKAPKTMDFTLRFLPRNTHCIILELQHSSYSAFQMHPMPQIPMIANPCMAISSFYRTHLSPGQHINNPSSHSPPWNQNTSLSPTLPKKQYSSANFCLPLWFIPLDPPL